MTDDQAVDPFDKIRFMNRIAILEGQEAGLKNQIKSMQSQIQVMATRFKALSNQLFRVSQVSSTMGKTFCDSLMNYLPEDVNEELKPLLDRDLVRQAVVSALREHGAKMIGKE